MRKTAIILALIFSFSIIGASSGATDKRSQLDPLASEINGEIVYARNRHIYKVVIGDWKPVELGEGEYARWSSDGKKIAVYDRRKIFVMDADGSNRKLVTDEGWSKHGCPIEFHTNCREIIFIRRNKRGLWAVDISNGKMRLLADFHDYTGEPGISADGNRIACRLRSDMYAIDLVKKTDFVYARRACSAGISPDGKWLMNNGNDMDPTHKSMSIRSWNRKDVKILRASICLPKSEWDNHHWSNHNDYICAQDDKTGDSYVIKVSAKRGTRVTRTGHALYPDLYVGDAETQGLTTSPVVLVNKDYNRFTSRVLIRYVERPTRANLDYAAYDSNVMHYDPTTYKPNPPPAQALSDLHFDKTLVPESLTDRLSAAPLTPVEKAAPMAWLPMTEYLMDWDFDLGYKLAEAGWKISEDTWSDHKIPGVYQEITRVYLHKNGDGTYDLWVRIEFKPWVRFLKNVDDEDSDGFPEIYGMIDRRLFDEKLVQRLLSDYTRRVLSTDEIADWGDELGTDWYDRYNTRTLESEQIEVWPNAQTEPQVKEELGGLVLDKPEVVIRGKPFGKLIYNVFLTRLCQTIDF